MAQTKKSVTGAEAKSSRKRPHQIGEVKMKNGNISNQMSPYVAIDIDCVVYSKHFRWTSFLERLPFSFLDGFISDRYLYFPNAVWGLSLLMKLGVNVIIVAGGGRKKVYEKLIDRLPYSEFRYYDKVSDMLSMLNYDNSIHLYFSIVSGKVQNVSTTKSKEFINWQTVINAVKS